jgi:hypothetical protein
MSIGLKKSKSIYVASARRRYGTSLGRIDARLAELTHNIRSLKQQLEMTKIINNIGVASMAQQQTESLRRTDYVVAQVDGSMEGLQRDIACGNKGSTYSRQGRSGRRIEAANANLSPCLRLFHDLWTEYIHGLGGRQPASQFSHRERGKSKHRYFRRNVIWKMMQKMETED